MQNKTAIVLIPVYKRPEVTMFCMDAMAALHKEAIKYGWSLRLVYVGDEEWAKDKTHSIAAEWVEHKNDYLGRKLNAGLEYAKRYSWDYLITMGSDDLLRPEIFASANYMDAEGFKFFGTNDCILYDLETGQAKRHNSGAQVIGAGRFLHRSYIEACDWALWPDEAMSGMDGRSEMKVEQVTGKYIQHMPCALYPFVVDIKSETNIHSYDAIPGAPVSSERLRSLFPALNRAKC